MSGFGEGGGLWGALGGFGGAGVLGKPCKLFLQAPGQSAAIRYVKMFWSLRLLVPCGVGGQEMEEEQGLVTHAQSLKSVQIERSKPFL